MADDDLEGLAKVIERSANARPNVMRQRVWAFLKDRGYDIGDLKARILNEMADERKANKGKLRSTEYNMPPAKLRQMFERTHRTTLVKGTKQSAPSQVRYELQGPLERYKSDLTTSERQALSQQIEHYIVVERGGARVTASYDGMPGGSGQRSGGVRDRDRLAYTDSLHFLSVTLQGHPFLTAVVRGLARGEVTVYDIGRVLFPDVKDKASLRMAGRTLIKAISMLAERRQMAERGLDRHVIPGTLVDQIEREMKSKRGRRR